MSVFLNVNGVLRNINIRRNSALSYLPIGTFQQREFQKQISYYKQR